MRKLESLTLFAASILLCTVFGLVTSSWFLPVAGLCLLALLVIACAAGRPKRAKLSSVAFAVMLGAVPGGFAAWGADEWMISKAMKSAEALIPQIEAHRARYGIYPDDFPTGGAISYERDGHEFRLMFSRPGFMYQWTWTSEARKWVAE